MDAEEYRSDNAAATIPALAVWFVIRTLSRQEKALAEDLDAKGIRYFLPLVQTVRYYGKRKFKIVAPLFPGYLFLSGAPEDAFSADRTGRVAQILKVVDQDGLSRDLDRLRLALDAGALLAPCPALEKGTLVEVTSGPFKGLQGCVEQEVRDNRLILGVELIGRAAAFEIDRSLLRVVD